MKKILKIILFLFVLLIIGLSIYYVKTIWFSHLGEFKNVGIDYRIIKHGDLIFRKGRSLVSQVVLLMDNDSPYSHVGIVYKDRDSIFVIHAVPGEEDADTDFVRMDYIDDFLDCTNNTGGSIYRFYDSINYKLPDSAASIAKSYFNEKIMFDPDFSMRSNNKLYCTELIWKAYKNAGIDLIENKLDTASIPLGDGPFLYPSSLIKSKYLIKIYSFKLKPKGEL
ncbi:MAG: hypothetical protein JXA68_00930 [Ignavibacteriales bacterium]|nr:hypothetical protein [Ignavibacteriales bacterium]